MVDNDGLRHTAGNQPVAGLSVLLRQQERAIANGDLAYDVTANVNTPGVSYIQKVTREHSPQLVWQMNSTGNWPIEVSAYQSLCRSRVDTVCNCNCKLERDGTTVQKAIADLALRDGESATRRVGGGIGF